MFDALAYFLPVFNALLIPLAAIISVVLFAIAARRFDPWQPLRSAPKLALGITPMLAVGVFNAAIALLAVSELGGLTLSEFARVSGIFLLVAVIAQTAAVIIFLALWFATPLGSRQRNLARSERRG